MGRRAARGNSGKRSGPRTTKPSQFLNPLSESNRFIILSRRRVTRIIEALAASPHGHFLDSQREIIRDIPE